MKDNKKKDKKKVNKKKKTIKISQKNFRLAIGGVAGFVLAAIIIIVCILVPKKESNDNNEEVVNNVTVEEDLDAVTEEQQTQAAERFAKSTGLEQAWEDMWLKTIELGEDNSDFLTISSCEIDSEDASRVKVTGVLPGIPKSDSDDIYLFALNNYETSIPSGAEPADTFRIEKTEPVFEMYANLNHRQQGSRLFKKFVVAAKVNGEYKILCTSRYVTNPERIAKYNTYKQSGIKGLLIDPLKIYSGELDDLGVQQGVYNINMSRLMGSGIGYEYGGRSYSFNAGEIQVLDKVFSQLSGKGIQITAILLNDPSSCSDLMHPNARGTGSAPYYMFNASDEGGVNAMAAVASFLAERYSGKGYGLVSNWVIGNEVNMRKEWNNYANVDTYAYTEQYANSFRVMYNAIKSVNAGARVYMPLDQRWNRNLSDGDYDGRDMLDAFASILRSKGDIDWGLAYHPYPVPLTNAKFWDTGSFKKYTTDSVDTQMVCMKNLHVVTDYLCRDEMRNPNGEVRSVILSEEGFTSTSGEGVQAAAYAYAYYIAANNQHIDGFMINRETDAPSEVAQGMAFGLTTSGGGHKQVYNVFKHIDKADGHQYTDQYLPVIGVGSWSEIIHSH